MLREHATAAMSGKPQTAAKLREHALRPYLADPDVTLYHGDALEVLSGLPDESVHCVVTSPPYWGLRDYGIEGQLGLEPTPELYVERMVGVFREVRRVLRADGTCWINIGDSYVSGQGGRQSSVGELPPTSRFDRPDPKPRPDLPNPPSGWAERAVTRRTYPAAETGLKPKDLVGIPWRLAFALQADGWYLRADIIWSKPNPMPESVTDRPTKAHEFVFLLTRSPRYFFDQEAVRERYDSDDRRPPHGPGQGTQPGQRPASGTRGKGPDGRTVTKVVGQDGSAQHRNGERWPNNGRNVRSVWTIATEPYPNAHFATFPTELARRCILAGTSERGCCPECGAPWVREVQKEYLSAPTYKAATPDQELTEGRNRNVTRLGDGTNHKTTGWRPSCDHPHEPVPATVLDPFAGSGTTLHVARQHGRHSIGIELNADYCKLAADRLAQLSLLAEAPAS